MQKSAILVLKSKNVYASAVYLKSLNEHGGTTIQNMTLKTMRIVQTTMQKARAYVFTAKEAEELKSKLLNSLYAEYFDVSLEHVDTARSGTYKLPPPKIKQCNHHYVCTKCGAVHGMSARKA